MEKWAKLAWGLGGTTLMTWGWFENAGQVFIWGLLAQLAFFAWYIWD